MTTASPRLALRGACSLAVVLFATSGLGAEPVWPEPSLREVPGVGVRARPVAIRFADDGHGRMFIVEQAGRIMVLHDGVLGTFLNISDRVRSPATSGGNEQGLLGLAFPPSFTDKGYFYLNYTRRTPTNDGATVLSRFRVSAGNPTEGPINTADPASEEILLTVAQPFSNHNGGDLHFGPDGYLYFGLGDGGSSGDPGNRAQDPLNLLGKMLRLDVETPVTPPATYHVPAGNPFVGNEAVRPEIWALGLRNPWRFSFDRLTGDLFIADVGQNAFEEVNFQPAGVGGQNYQWRRYEGFALFSSTTQLTVGESTPPILDTRRADGHRSITGGYVYRGDRYPRMQGRYIFADYVSGTGFVAQQVNGEWQMRLYPGLMPNVSSFGEDEEGNLFVANLNTGRVFEVRDRVDSAHMQVLDVARDPADGRVSFTYGVALGGSYQVEGSDDLASWMSVGPSVSAPVDGDHRLTFEEAANPPAGAQRRFFRVVED